MPPTSPTPTPTDAASRCVWAAIERGLDGLFKALAVRVWLIFMLAFTTLPPDTPDSATLRRVFAVIVGAAILWTTAAVAGALGRLAHGFLGATRPARAGIGGAACVAALEIAQLAGRAELVEMSAGAVEALSLTGRALFACVVALALTVVGRVAARVAADADADAPRGADGVRRGLIALAALVGVVGTARAIEAAAPDAAGALATAQLAALLVVASFVLRPIHAIAIAVRQREIAPPGAGDATAFDAAGDVADRAASPADADDDGGRESEGDDESWIPRAERLRRRGGPPPAPPQIAAWEAGKAGLKAFAGAFTVRVLVAIFQGVLAPGAESPFGDVAVELLGLVGVVASAYVALGAWRFRATPDPVVARLALAGTLFAVGLFLYDGAMLALFYAQTGGAELVADWRAVALGRDLVALATVGTVLIGAWQLTRGLIRRASAATPLITALASFTLAFACQVGVALVWKAFASDTRAVATPLGLAALVTISLGLIATLSATSRACDAIDDTVTRLTRAAER